MIMQPLSYPDEMIRQTLQGVHRIAMVGASANPARSSWIVFKYLLSRGFEMVGVNPGLAGGNILGAPVYARLADVPGGIDMVDIFRASEAAAGVVDEALALPVPPRVIWMQLGVRNDAAAAKAEAMGVRVIMDRCPKIEFGRLSGEIGWTGVNSRMLSAKRPRLSGRGYQNLSIDRK